MDATYDYSAYSYSTTNLDPAVGGAMVMFGMVTWLVSMAIAVVVLIAMWKLFTKAGKPGWASIVPIYNTIVMLEIVGRPIWWIILLLIPFVNIVIGIMVVIDFAKAYGKGAGYGVLMLFFPYIMYPILAFSKDTTYVGPVAAAAGAPAPAAPVAPVAPVAPEAPVEPAPQPPVTPTPPQQ